MANHELDQLRKQVDEINLQLLHLLNKRGEIVQKLSKSKYKARNALIQYVSVKYLI